MESSAELKAEAVALATEIGSHRRAAATGGASAAVKRPTKGDRKRARADKVDEVETERKRKRISDAESYLKRWELRESQCLPACQSPLACARRIALGPGSAVQPRPVRSRTAAIQTPGETPGAASARPHSQSAPQRFQRR